MGCCCSSTEYVTPRPHTLLPDPTGACTFSASRNALMSQNFNVFKGEEDNALLWLFLRVKGNLDGVNDSYFVLENFWRPPFSDEGDVLCWCHLPAFQRDRSYSSSGHEEYGISPDLNSEVYWYDSQYDQPALASMILWKREEWQFHVRIGFYRDRYMEEPLGVLEICSRGWIVQKIGGPGKSFVQPIEDVKNVRYVFEDRNGLHFPIDVNMVLKNNSRVLSYDCCMFGFLVTPGSYRAIGYKFIVSSKAGHDPGLAFLVAFVCASAFSPENIGSNLRVSQMCQKSID
ncbi:hypothetical protein O6H91_16G063700 [Diphasiastrum complanatum]|uniref:Uncharacterized protein n=1 Tax=Diphasiastrum complanatum TaxID=34168 RepID=A0ACC2BD52_DIPCM|nr:hypothetical protein O6H91_16G063700 [Diphasiastrum complanatum]